MMKSLLGSLLAQSELAPAPPQSAMSRLHEPADCLVAQLPCKSDFNVVPFQPPCQYIHPASLLGY